LRLSDAVFDRAFHFANGAPCRTEYEDYTPLLHALGGGVQRDEGEPLARTIS
jgi:hypothetical protein